MNYKYMIIILFLLLPLTAKAGYGSGEIARVYTDNSGMTYFGLTVQLADTCSNYNIQFRFDSTTAGGKGMLSLLLASNAAGKTIDVWYSASPNPGTGPCASSDYSTVNIIGNP